VVLGQQMRAPSTDGGPYRATRLLVLFLLHLSPPPVNCRSRKKRHQVRSGQRVAAARESMKQAGRLSGAGRLAEAEQQYAEALRHNPRYLEALGNRAMLLPQLGRAREALAEMKRLVTLAPDQPLVQYNAGLMYAGMQRHDEAIAALGLSADQFAKQEGQEPQRSMALDSLGASMMKLQRVPEALHSFSVAAQVDPAAITPRLNRGAALRERDRAGEASLDYLAALGQAAHDSSAGIIDANTPSLEEVVSDTMYAIEDASWNVHQADKPSLLPLWQRVQTILNALVQQLSVESAKQPPPPAALTQDTLDQVISRRQGSRQSPCAFSLGFKVRLAG
jgi:tetratricopeptide (TPR) repeat protein